MRYHKGAVTFRRPIKTSIVRDIVLMVMGITCGYLLSIPPAHSASMTTHGTLIHNVHGQVAQVRPGAPRLAYIVTGSDVFGAHNLDGTYSNRSFHLRTGAATPIHWSKAFYFFAQYETLIIVTSLGSIYAIDTGFVNGRDLNEEMYEEQVISPDRSVTLIDSGCDRHAPQGSDASILALPDGEHAVIGADALNCTVVLRLSDLAKVNELNSGEYGYGQLALSNDGSRLGVMNTEQENPSSLRIFTRNGTNFSQIADVDYAAATEGFTTLSHRLIADPTQGSDGFIGHYSSELGVTNFEVDAAGVSKMGRLPIALSTYGGIYARYVDGVGPQIINGIRSATLDYMLTEPDPEPTINSDEFAFEDAIHEKLWILKRNTQYLNVMDLSSFSTQPRPDQWLQSMEDDDNRIYHYDGEPGLLEHFGPGQVGRVNGAGYLSTLHQQVHVPSDVLNLAKVVVNRAVVDPYTKRDSADYYSILEQARQNELALIFRESDQGGQVEAAFIITRNEETHQLQAQALPFPTKECYREAFGLDPNTRVDGSNAVETARIHMGLAGEATPMQLDCDGNGTGLVGDGDFVGKTTDSDVETSSGMLGCGLLSSTSSPRPITPIVFTLALLILSVSLRRRHYMT